MSLSQLCTSGFLIVLFVFIFQFTYRHLLRLLYYHAGCRYSPESIAGLCYGAAYAFGSVGTYLLSLINDGTFLTSGNNYRYLSFSKWLAIVGLVLVADDIVLLRRR